MVKMYATCLICNYALSRMMRQTQLHAEHTTIPHGSCLLKLLKKRLSIQTKAAVPLRNGKCFKSINCQPVVIFNCNKPFSLRKSSPLSFSVAAKQ